MRRVLPLLVVVLLSGCADEGPSYAGLETNVISAPPVPVRIDPYAMELVVGVAVQLEVEPRSRHERYSRRDRVVLRPANPDLFSVYASDEERSFVLVGLRAGESCIVVLINEEQEECIPVRVHDAWL